jgi:hypothetical protein
MTHSPTNQRETLLIQLNRKNRIILHGFQHTAFTLQIRENVSHIRKTFFVLSYTSECFSSFSNECYVILIETNICDVLYYTDTHSTMR